MDLEPKSQITVATHEHVSDFQLRHVAYKTLAVLDSRGFEPSHKLYVICVSTGLSAPEYNPSQGEPIGSRSGEAGLTETCRNLPTLQAIPVFLYDHTPAIQSKSSHLLFRHRIPARQ